MEKTFKSGLAGLGGTLGGFVALGVLLALFKPTYGPLMFFAIELGWVLYSLFRLVRGILKLRIRDWTSPHQAKSDLVFGASALSGFAVLYLWTLFFPPHK